MFLFSSYILFGCFLPQYFALHRNSSANWPQRVRRHWSYPHKLKAIRWLSNRSKSYGRGIPKYSPAHRWTWTVRLETSLVSLEISCSVTKNKSCCLIHSNWRRMSYYFELRYRETRLNRYLATSYKLFKSLGVFVYYIRVATIDIFYIM